MTTIPWPDGKRFAFTVFDDTDCATLENVRAVYALLADCGFRATKSTWMVRGDPNQGFAMGQTCEDPDYLQWLLELQSKGFEIGWHNATWHGLPREQVASALDRFKMLFGHDPFSAANHSANERVYWCGNRVSGINRLVYNLLTRYRRGDPHAGHREGDPYFWGDLCRQRVKYWRNFIYRDVNTLRACPWMPYHDPDRPYVNYWFASSEGHDLRAFNRCLCESNQDRLEEQGGACIMYTHFAYGFCDGGKLDPRFQQLMTRLAKKNGWFVPVATLLDHLLALGGHGEITDAQRRRLERKWLRDKIFTGTT